jgi:hypothetical protein
MGLIGRRKNPMKRKRDVNPLYEDKRCPYYYLVPQAQYNPNGSLNLDANIRFRREVLTRAVNNRELQEELEVMCARDILFWLNTFGWTYDPRPRSDGRPLKIPFVSYGYQDEAMLLVNQGIEEQKDVMMLKSRDMGATWIMVAVFVWRFLYKHDETFLMGSRKEELVEKPGDHKTLFAKVDFLFEHLPSFLKPKAVEIERTKLHFGNLLNGTTIDGESTNADFAAGDRRTAIALDEFALMDNGGQIDAITSQTTNCRLFSSTPRGRNHMHKRWEIINDGESGYLINMHWSRHPEKAVGLYYDDAGKARSPWYDAAAKKIGHRQLVAQELDMDFVGSGFQFFDEEALLKQEELYVRMPYMVCDLEILNGKLEGLYQTETGRLKLWISPDGSNKLPDNRMYTIGADISTGTGASNSVLVVGDCLTKEKVAEYCCADMAPQEFAKIAVILGKMFLGPNDREAYMCWEGNGPGAAFGEKVIELGYSNYYRKKAEHSLVRKDSDIPGWYSTREYKRVLLESYRQALAEERFMERSKWCLAECRKYIYNDQQVPVYERGDTLEDPSGARENHGDRVIATALAWRMIRELDGGTIKDDANSSDVPIPEGSMAFRMQQRLAKIRQATTDDWSGGADDD